MAEFTFPIAFPGGVRTGTRARDAYAWAPRLDAKTRTLVFVNAARAAGDPAETLVLLTVTTPQGSYRPDPTLGPDYEILRTLGPNTRAAWRRAVEGALARFVPSRLTDVRVEVDPPRGRKLLWLVEFRDARASTRTPQPSRLPFATEI